MVSRIGDKIFDHMQMMQHYEDLKIHEESLRSIFQKPEPLVLRTRSQVEPKLKVEFVKEWNKKYGKELITNWNLETDGTVSKSKFSQLFAQVSYIGYPNKN